MSCIFWRGVAVVVLGLCPSLARAQTQPTPTPPATGYVAPYPGVTLWMHSTEPGTQLWLYPREAKVDSAVPLFTCAAPPCQVQVAPARYKIRVSETEETFGGVRPVDVESHTRVTLTPDVRWKRGVGLGLGIAGTIAVMVGSVMLMSSGRLMGEERADDRESGNQAAIGGLAFLGGAIATPIGWVMFGSSFKPDVEIERD